MAEEQGNSPLPPKLNLKKQVAVEGPGEPEGAPAPEEQAAPETPPEAEAKPRLTIKKDMPQPTPPATEQKRKSETMRIQIPELQATAAQAAAPAPVAAPETVDAEPSAEPPSADASTAKRETSRIPLEAAKAAPPAEGGAGPKTIRIKPVATPSTVRVSPPAEAGAPATDSKSAAKRQTSRISLEAALAANEGAAEPAAGAPPSTPKTIRLKRPSEAATVKMQRPPDQEGDEAKDAMSKTARLDETSSIDAEGITPTRRKTIKVKRPSQQTAVKGLSVARPDEAEQAESLFKQPDFEAVVEDKPHWMFSAVSIVAILVTCVLVYVLVAQTFGPNVSLTKLSYGAPGLDLAWPGKLVVQ